MKKVLLALAILALATPVFAADAYVALYADVSHSICSVTLPPPGGFMPFDCYIFMTSHLGVQAAEYRIIVPAGIIAQTAVTNPLINVAMGDPIAGISISFAGCQTGWVWAQRIPCYITITTPAYIEIVPRPDIGLQVASCEVGFPIYTATVLNHLALNQSCAVATEDASWGAIKSLF